MEVARLFGRDAGVMSRGLRLLAERLAEEKELRRRVGRLRREMREDRKGRMQKSKPDTRPTPGGTVLRQKTQINFGGAGLPLSRLSNVAAMLRGSSAPTPVTTQNIGRNEPCPCGSGKKFKKCCGGRRSTD